MDSLSALSPVDGRYEAITAPLSAYLSEGALIRYRVRVEIAYLLALSNMDGFGPTFTAEQKQFLENLQELSEKDTQLVKDIETKGHGGIPATRHDVKAVEYFIRLKCKEAGVEDLSLWIHFALTSEDTNNISYALMLRDALEHVILPELARTSEKLDGFAKTYAGAAMLARTHGQSASPTTFGKEMRVFYCRLARQTEELRKRPLLAKLNGATGNYNAHTAAAPALDWLSFSREFIESFNAGHEIPLTMNAVTTQIEPHDTYAETFHNLARINSILIDLDQDMWRYISDGWVMQKMKEGEVGSSTMPHKVNPIDFENSEGNLGLANALLSFFASKLPISRLQRDLSDSTVERNFATAFAHCLIGYGMANRALGNITPSAEAMRDELNRHPEVIAEAIQTILRREGVEGGYETLKELLRGKETTLADMRAFIDTLSVTSDVKEELKKLSPESYIGLAKEIAENSDCGR